eukprot:jgi/Ulvmu1/2896/UM146_0038.1
MDCTIGVAVIPCAAGVRDCCFHASEGLQDTDPSACAASAGDYSPPGQETWLLAIAFCTMALMSFGIGANDAANSWGTSVGSGAVTLTQAVMTGGIMDWLGATLLGSGVSDTIQHISDINGQDCWACGFCDSKMTLFMLGMSAALLATAVFLLLSSTTGMPVSTTHAIIGAVVGMAMVGTSPACLAWGRLADVALTWVTSPLLAGLFGAGLHYSLHRTIMSAPDADQRAMKACPWLFGVTMSCVAALVLLKSPITRPLPLPVSAGIAGAVSILTVALAHFYAVPIIQRRAASAQVDRRLREVELGTLADAKGIASSGGGFSTSGSVGQSDTGQSDKSAAVAPASASPDPPPSPSEDQQEVGEQEGMELLQEGMVEELSKEDRASRLDGETASGSHESLSQQQQHALQVFKYLLVFVAALESFAHGANDTANATGAFSAVWTTFHNGLESCRFGSTPIWIMALGGLFVFLGVFTAGARVIQTMGFGLANIDFFRGFCIELGSALAVVSATALGIPVSTTHCQVGAVIFVGWTAVGYKSVRWSMFGWIALTWLITLPTSAGLAALLLACSKVLVRA